MLAGKLVGAALLPALAKPAPPPGPMPPGPGPHGPAALFALVDANMRAANPAVIPRNHLVEAALSAAVEREDFGPFEGLLDVLSRPYEDRPGLERYAVPPRPEERVLQTFSGT
jgi:hypothetical protein